MGSIVNQLGIVTKLETPDGRKEVGIWVKGWRDELWKATGKNNDRVSVGDWVLCTVNMDQLIRFRRTRIEAPVSVSKKGLIRITVDVTFSPGNECAFSELLGKVFKCPAARWPSSGTYSCQVVAIPETKRSAIERNNTFWMTTRLMEDGPGFDDHRSITSQPTSDYSVRSGGDGRFALVLHVNSSRHPDFQASLWIQGEQGGLIGLVTERSSGERTHLRRGNWIYCQFRRYNDPPISAADYDLFEVTTFNAPDTDELLPLVKTRPNLIKVRSSVQVRDLMNGDHEGFAILPNVNFLGDVGVSVKHWYNIFADGRQYLRYSGLVPAVFVFAHQDIGLGVFWYLVSIGDDVHLSPQDLDQKLERYATYQFLDNLQYEAPASRSWDDSSGSEVEQPKNFTMIEHERSIVDCRSFADLEEFLWARREDVRSLSPDYGCHEKNVKLTKMFTFESVVLCYSPRLGWCAANACPSLMHENSEREWNEVRRGEWLRANLLRTRSSNGCRPIVEWLVCPDIKRVAPLFTLFCEDPDAGFNVMEALAFNDVLVEVEYRRRRFTILNTPMGKVWVPAEMQEDEADECEGFVIQCPEYCCCFEKYCVPPPVVPKEREPTEVSAPAYRRSAPSQHSGSWLSECGDSGAPRHSGDRFEDRARHVSKTWSDYPQEENVTDETPYDPAPPNHSVRSQSPPYRFENQQTGDWSSSPDERSARGSMNYSHSQPLFRARSRVSSVSECRSQHSQASDKHSQQDSPLSADCYAPRANKGSGEMSEERHRCWQEQFAARKAAMVAERAALRDEEHEAQIRKTSKTLSSDRASTKSSASVTQSVKEVFETVLEKASARQENRFQNELKMPPTEVAIASKTTESPTTNRETERESESGAVVSADRNESVASWGDDSDDDCLTEDGEQYDNEPPEPKPFIVRRD